MGNGILDGSTGRAGSTDRKPYMAGTADFRFLIVIGPHGTKLPAARCRKLASCTIAEPAAETLKGKPRRRNGGPAAVH
jgi:hypothetical protein